MEEPMPHSQEIVSFIKEKRNQWTWNQIEKELKIQGFTSHDIDFALKTLYPGTKPRKYRAIYAGFLGAAIGILLWLILAAVFHSGH